MELDCRGQRCPLPVIRTRQALEQMREDRLIVLVSTEVQAQNVRRAVETGGHTASVEQNADHFRVVATRGAAQCETCTPPSARGPLWLFASDRIGPEPALGAVLAEMLCHTLAENPVRPSVIVLVNEGVRLACIGSRAVESLRALEQTGTRLLVCGTCLEYLGLLEAERVGTVSNMYEIVETITAAERIISL